MAGYNGFSKSNNACAAEASGRYPATKAARILGVPAAFIKEACDWATHGEWHHTSKFYTAVAYYDCAELREWLDDARDQDGELIHATSGSECLAAWKERHAARKAGATEIVHTGCTVEWLEWVGTRNHPRAIERKATGCTVTDRGGKFVEVRLPDGTAFKKGKDTNGFRFKPAK